MFFNLLWVEILMKPIFNLLIVFLAIFGGNLGIAIILLTLMIRLTMIKTSTAGNDMQKGMANIQPKIQEIQEKYKDDPKKVSEETMKLFKSQKGQLKGCLMMLIQIPVFIGLYYVIRKISMNEIPDSWLYSFFSSFGQNFLDPANINHIFMGQDLVDPAIKHPILAGLAGIFTYLQMKLTNLAKPASTPAIPGAKTPDMNKMMGFMSIFMVVIMGSFVYKMAGGIGLYIVTTTLFSVVQYTIQYRALLKVKRTEFKSKK